MTRMLTFGNSVLITFMAQITILTLGSRGDVQPYVALGAGLQAAGHRVALATADQFAELTTQAGLEHRPISAEFLELATSQQGKQAFAGKGLSRLNLMKQVMPMLRRMLDNIWQVAQDSQAIVYHPKAMGGYHLAEKLNIPAFLAMAAPAYSPTRQFATPLLLSSNLGPLFNKLSYNLLLWAVSAPYRGLINQWRKEALSLPPFKDDNVLRDKPVTKLYCYSPHLVPTPADWGADTVATGFWFLPAPQNWQPPTELVNFLEASPRPVYIGFGSMPSEDAEAKTRLVLEAVRQASVRAVLATGWGGLAAASNENVFALKEAPHSWLFPRMAAVVHHGGAGTTGEGLRAGKPSLICPFFGDQPFWGGRVAALGVGPTPISQKALTAEKLAAALRTLTTDAEMQRRAAELGQKICAEDGVARAVEVIVRQLK